MHYNSRKIRIWPIAITILLVAGFIISKPGLPQNVGAKALFQPIGQDTFSFNHAMIRFTPPQDSCGDRVELQLAVGVEDIDIAIYGEVTQIEGQRFNATDRLTQVLDKFSATGGSVSFQLPNPLRLTKDDDVYVAISTQPGALSADVGTSDTSDTNLAYISYDGTNWRESQLAFNIQLQTKECSPDVPAGPAATNTPFVPTPTATFRPTSTPIPTTAPDEPTYTPTATIAAQSVCKAPSMRMQVAASSLDSSSEKEEQTTEAISIPLRSEPLAPERVSSSILRKQSLNDFYLLLSSGQLQRVDLSQQPATSAKLDRLAQVEPNITGTLLMPDGNPAAGFPISVYEVDSEDRRYGDPVFIGRTDSNGLLGAYLISGKYLLRVEPPLKNADGLPVDGIQTLEHLFEVGGADNTGGTDLDQLTLPATTKVIQGKIVHTDGTSISETRVDAFNASTGQYVYTYPDNDGVFVLNVGGGSWQLSLLPAVGVTWIPVDVRQDVQFQRDETAETVGDLIFNVRPADAMMVGRVTGPDGQPLTSETVDVFGLNFNVRFDVFDTVTERSASGFLDASGAFTIPLASGLYEGNVWLDNALYPLFTGASLDDVVQVTTDNINVGQIRVLANDSTVRGVVNDSDGVPIPNVSIELWKAGGLSRSGTTDENGLYEMTVPSGQWWIKPSPQSYQAQLFSGKPQQVELNATAPTQADFSLEPSAGNLFGTVVDDQDRLLNDIDGYVYIRRDSDIQPVVSVRVENGRFTAKVPYGDLRVGMFLGPDSPYLLPEEATPELLAASVLAIANLDDLLHLSLTSRDQAAFIQNATSDSSVKLRVISANAEVQGQLQESDGTPVTGIAGDVIAIEQGRPQNWKRSAINPADGSYRLSLIAGTWDLVYELAVNENDKTVLPNPEQPAVVIAEDDTVITQNLAVAKLVLAAKGVVVDENDRSVSNASVLIRLGSYESTVRSDENGLFQLYVPASVEAEIEAAATDASRRSAATGKSRSGSGSRRPLRQFTLLPDLPSKVIALEVDDAASSDVPEMRVVLRTSNAYLTGQVLGLDEQPVEGARVSGVNLKDAQEFTVITDAIGCFNGRVKTDGAYEWLITVRYQDENGILMESKFTMPGGEAGDEAGGEAGDAAVDQLQSASASPLAMANLPVNSGIVMQYKGTIPLPETHTFLVASGWSHTMSDGFTIEIAPNAINTNESEVRIQLIPRFMLDETYMHSLVKYGYQISLNDSSGRAILSEFRSNVLITLGYEEQSTVTNEEELIVARTANDLWLKESRVFQNQEDNSFSVSIRKPGVYAILQPNEIPELSEALAELPTSPLALTELAGNVEANTAVIEGNEPAIWTISIVNTGELSSQDVILTAQLPSGTQIADSSLADGWVEQDTLVYHLTLDPLEGGESVSKVFAVNLSADSRLTTILEPAFVLQSTTSEDSINISTGLGNNINVDRAPTASEVEEDFYLIEHQIYLPVIAQ